MIDFLPGFVLFLPQIHLAFIRMQGVSLGLGIIAEDQLAAVHVKALRSGKFDILFVEGADYQNLLGSVFHGIHIEFVGAVEILLVFAVADTGQLLPQGNGFPVEVQNGVGIFFLLGSVQPGVVGVDADPGGVCIREAGVLFCAPLNWSAGTVPAGVTIWGKYKQKRD